MHALHTLDACATTSQGHPRTAKNPAEHLRLQQLLQVADHELALLVQDRDMLASYDGTNRVHVDGDTYEAV